MSITSSSKLFWISGTPSRVTAVRSRNDMPNHLLRCESVDVLPIDVNTDAENTEHCASKLYYKISGIAVS